MVANGEALFWHEEILPCVEFGSSRLEGSQERGNGPYRRRYRNCDDHERGSEHSGGESFHTVDIRMLILCASSRLENLS